MCRDNDHGGRRCKSSTNKAKRSTQNRDYYQAHKVKKALTISDVQPNTARVDDHSFTLKRENLPSADNMRSLLEDQTEAFKGQIAWTQLEGLDSDSLGDVSPKWQEKTEEYIGYIRDAFNYTFSLGDAEYKLKATTVAITPEKTDQWDRVTPMHVAVEGFIYSEEGHGIGYWERVAYFPTDGAAFADYRYLQMYNDYQGKGLGTEVITFFDATMKSWGVENIELQANMDVGGYAWARSGNDWDIRMGESKKRDGTKFDKVKAWEVQQEEIYTSLQYTKETRGDQDGSITEMIQRLKQPYNAITYPTPFEVTNAGKSGAYIDDNNKNMWAGKRAMLSGSWYSTRKL